MKELSNAIRKQAVFLISCKALFDAHKCFSFDLLGMLP